MVTCSMKAQTQISYIIITNWNILFLEKKQLAVTYCILVTGVADRLCELLGNFCHAVFYLKIIFMIIDKCFSFLTNRPPNNKFSDFRRHFLWMKKIARKTFI